MKVPSIYVIGTGLCVLGALAAIIMGAVPKLDPRMFWLGVSIYGCLIIAGMVEVFRTKPSPEKKPKADDA